ncbi:MAG: histidine kinase [Cytophagales bacterium]|nr:histidine kinase [Cytophagales bacterium]
MKAHTLILLLMAFLVGPFSVAQKKEADYAQVRKGRSFDFQEIEKLADSDPIRALDMLDALVRRNSRLLDQSSQIRVYELAGKINYNLGQYQLAVNNYRKAVEANQGSKLSLGSLKRRTGLSGNVRFDYASALYANQQYGEAMRYANEYVSGMNDPKSKINGLLLSANVLIDSGAVAGAFEFLDKAQAWLDNIEDAELQLELELALGRAREQAIQLDSSLFNYQNALELSDSLNLEQRSEDITNSIGRVYQNQNDPEAELSFKQSRRARSIATNNRARQNTLDLDIASIYLDLDQAEEAIPYLQESVELSEEEGNLETNIAARKSLSDVYAASGDYNRALDNYRSYTQLVDKLYQNKEREIALSAQVQRDLFERQQTINSLEKDRQLYENEIAILEQERTFQAESLSFQRRSIYGLSLSLLTILGISLLLYRSNRKKNLSNQLLALKSLRSQMNPHFIFNALNSVNSFISMNDVREANRYLSDFSRLMRIVMENSQKEFIPLEEELEVLKLYLKLEHYRFQDQFQYELQIDDGLDSQDLQLPPMLAQPYIENAIWHGLRYKEEKGHLYVEMVHGKEELTITIKDDGIGRARSRALKTTNQKKNTSTGMKNTQERIDLLNATYGSDIRVLVKDLEEGTEVTIHLPKKLLT